MRITFNAESRCDFKIFLIFEWLILFRSSFIGCEVLLVRLFDTMADVGRSADKVASVALLCHSKQVVHVVTVIFITYFPISNGTASVCGLLVMIATCSKMVLVVHTLLDFFKHLKVVRE